MANVKISGLTPDTSPTSDDLIPTVTDPAGTPASRKVTLANAITKAHGLSDGLVKVATGTMAVASAGTDYSTPSSTDVLTNKTFDANGTGNSLSNVEVADMAASAVVTAVEGLSSSDNDTSIPTTAAVIDGLDTKAATSHTHELDDLGATGITDGYVLTADGANGAVWEATSAGQSSYNAIVAPSGGDYTTLGAAIAAASSGWRIFVKAGTYSESAISTALNNLTIHGAGGENSIISLGTNACTFSGTGVTLSDIGFTASTGYLHMTGTEAHLNYVLWDSTDIGSNTSSIYMNGARSKVTSCTLKCTLISGTPTRPFIFLNAVEQNFENNYVLAPVRSTSTSAGVLYLGSARECSVVGNKFVSGSDAAGGICIMNNAGLRSTFVGNAHQYADNAVSTFAYYSTASRSTFTANNVRARIFIDAMGNRITSNYVQSTNTSNVGIHISDNDCVVADNFVEVSGTSTVGVTVDSACTNAVITGNKFGTPATGVTISASTCTNCIIANNDFSTVTTTPINDSGLTTIIQNNQGADANNTKNYVRMKNTAGVSVNAGDVVVWKAVAAGDEVTTTTSAGDDKVFGMAVATITNNSYGYIQTAGKTTLLKVDGTTDIAIGDPLTTFTTAGIAQKATAGDMVFAYALEAYTANDSNGIIDALIIEPRLI